MTTGAGREDQRQTDDRWNLWFGAGTLAFALVCLLIWFPADIRGGFVQTSVAGRTVPGDRFFPILLVAAMIPLSLAQLFSHWRHAGRETGEAVGRITPRNLVFLLRLCAVVLSGLIIMTWTGPVLVTAWVAASGADISGYRALSGQFPINVAGFVLGGEWIVCHMILMTRGRITGVDLVAASVVIAALVLIFNGLLDDVLLPPNADL